MNAGPDGIQAEVIEMMLAEMNANGDKNKNWLQFTVKGRVDLYADCYTRARNRRIHDKVFAPFGLTHESFIERQSTLSDLFIGEVLKQVQETQVFLASETIIAGIDNSTGVVQPHIYCIRRYGDCGGNVTCCDALGYAMAGSGAAHADAVFMQGGFTRHFSNWKTLFLCYEAKRRSEVAIGVGPQTDIHVMGPAGGFFYLGDAKNEHKELPVIYERMVSRQRDAQSQAVDEMADYIADKIPKSQSQLDEK